MMFDLIDVMADIYLDIHDALIVPALVVGVIGLVWVWNYVF